MKFKTTIVIAALILSACKSRTTQNAESTAGWAGRMQQIGESFSTLLPITMDPIQFNDPANQDVIDAELTRLAHFAHDVSAMKKKPSDDPALEYVGKEFSSDMVEAKRQLRIGNRAFARFIIRGASNYCVSCHTQTDRGPHFLAKPVGSYFQKLASLDKANYLIAIWNFDDGLSEYEKAMNSPDVALQPYASLESATLRALAVAVRVKNDPQLSERIINRIVTSKWAPVYLQLSAMKWQSAVKEWRDSKKTPHTLDDAKALISKAWSRQMESPLSRAGLIEALRASALLHELLTQKKPGKTYAETLYYTGLNSESLKDLDPFSMNEAYYEACIRHLPHSDTAKNCYLRLEGAEIANYSAFDSMPLPQKVRENLNTLRKLAEPTEGSWMEWGKNHEE